MGNGFSTADMQDRRLLHARDLLLEHDRAMRAKGFDPEMIGEHEVKPVCCANCGHAIPWRVIRGRG